MDKTPAWETFLRRGRIEEEAGRLKAAERAYRKALFNNQDFDSLEREFSRFLENCSRLKESEAHLLRAMELGWPREEGEATLARLRGKSSPSSSAREDESPTKEVKAPGPSEGDGDAWWPETFSALLCEHKYLEAFRLGDAMLEQSVRMANANAFLWPWWHKVYSRFSEKKVRFCSQELKRVKKAGAGGEFPGWFAFCRGVLLLELDRVEEAMAEYEFVKRLPPRYSVMHHPFVMYRLTASDFKWTIGTCQALLKIVPEYWWFQCRMGEALMADGDVAKGLREFERAEKGAADLPARQSIMTWHGAALLWAGEYRRAVVKLDEAVGIGTKKWVNCWRGGAYLKLGKFQKALADLDLAIKTDPQDPEAYVWRGEAYRHSGRPTEAIRDLDRAIALNGEYTWAYFNRALARFALGDERGMAADFSMIPGEVTAVIRGARKAGKAAAPGPKEMRTLLKAGLARAKGIRRPEDYLNSIWMGRGSPLAPEPHR